MSVYEEVTDISTIDDFQLCWVEHVVWMSKGEPDYLAKSILEFRRTDNGNIGLFISILSSEREYTYPLSMVKRVWKIEEPV